jgi:putative ABC transport system permease protein
VEHLSGGTFTFASLRGRKMKTPMPTLLIFGRTPGDRLLNKFRSRVDGRVIEKEDEIMVGEIAATNLGIRPGDTLPLFKRTFRVVGVYRSDVSFEQVGAMVPNAVVQAELKTDAIAMGFIYLRPGAEWEKVREAVEGRHEHLTVIPTEQFTTFYNQLEYIDWFVWTVSLVSVIVGGLGVLNTMLMSVSERTREIGTLRAVGWSRRMVLRLILSEGTALSVAGGAAGLALGVAGAETLIRFAPQGFLATHYAPTLFAIAMGVAVALGFAGALYPAWQASKLSPIEALKYE